MTFDQIYSQYYDLLYKDKNYKVEVDYLIEILGRHGQKAKSILELGCGTGNHAKFFSEYGYKILGIDRSKDMLEIAKKRFADDPNVTFELAEIEDYIIDKNFDAIFSLFHVISYLNDTNSLLDTFANVSKHLKPDGLFIFDTWFGPGVLSDQPEVRMKKIKNDQIEVVRIASPTLHIAKNVCDVNYQIYVEDFKENRIYKNEEKHSMRYFFLPEMQLMLEQSGLVLIECLEYLKFESPKLDTWNAVFVCKKK